MSTVPTDPNPTLKGCLTDQNIGLTPPVPPPSYDSLPHSPILLPFPESSTFGEDERPDLKSFQGNSLPTSVYIGKRRPGLPSLLISSPTVRTLYWKKPNPLSSPLKVCLLLSFVRGPEVTVYSLGSLCFVLSPLL